MKRLRLFLSRLNDLRLAAGTMRALLIAPLWLVRRRHIVLEMEIQRTESHSTEDEPEIEWRQIGESDVMSILEVNPTLDRNLVTARFREGLELNACLLGGRIVHYRWYASKPSTLTFLGLAWQPEEGDYTVLGAYTDPRVRNRGVNRAVVRQGIERARARGFRRVVSFIADWNTPSLKGTTHSGLRPIGTVTLWTMGFARWYTSTGRVEVVRRTVRVPKP